MSNQKYIFLFVIAFLAFMSCGEGANNGSTLQMAAGDRLLIGTAASLKDLEDPALGKLIADQFGCLTAENEMKPEALQPTAGNFNFQTADRIAEFTIAHHQRLIGHTLCWHQQTPSWMFEDEKGEPLSREVALANLHNYIHTVVRHFKGKVYGWDVVNEAVGDGGDSYLRDTPARRAIGNDYVLKAFEFAHEADPDVQLYYNDFNIEIGEKRDRALRLIREIKAAGLRIDGVGVQGHWLLDEPEVSEIERGIKAFSELGINVMITELDIDPLPRLKGGAGADLSARQKAGFDPYKTGLPKAVQQALANRYEQIFTMLLRYPRVTRITFWGSTDGTSWLNNWPVRGRTNYPLLWDRQGKEKAAFYAVMRTLRMPAKNLAP